MRLHFHGQDYQDIYVEWQVTEGEVVGKYRLPSHHTELVYCGIHCTK